MNKLRAFQSFVYSSTYNIFAIVETWLSHFIFDKEVFPTDFTIYRKDRVTRGGGVLLAVHNSLPSFKCQSPHDLEVVTVEMKVKSAFIICVVYIPPNSSDSYYTVLFQYLDTLLASHQTIILGDFNLPDICWSTLSGNSSSSNDLCDLAFHYDLTQVIDFPTHVNGNTLDLVFSPPDFAITDVKSIDVPSLRSDHFMITFSFPFSTSIKTKNSFRASLNYKKADFESISSHLLEHDFSYYFQTTNIELLWNYLKDCILHLIALFTPPVTKKSQHYPKWFNSSVRHQLHKVHSLRKQYKKHTSPHRSSCLSSAESHLQTEILNARVNYESTLVQTFAFSNDSKIYNYMKSFSKNSGIPAILQYQSSLFTSATDKANAFNKFFHSVYNSSSCTDIALDVLPFPNESLCSISITSDDTFQALCSLNPSKAMGGDGIPPIVLHHCAAALFEPIHHLFEQCLLQSYIPSEWRSHHITPIPKSKDKSLITNYRPISLLSCISKVFKRVIFDKISDFIYKNYISHHQFGFIRNRSTLQQLLLYQDFLCSSFDNHQQVDAIYLDIQKAFDSVPHRNILIKLWAAGITGSLWKFFKCYLSNRKQCVIVDNQASQWLPVTSGVPQGSILGPLLFIIYINDLPSILNSSLPFLFADDTKCCKVITSVNDVLALQSDLDCLSEWSRQNKLFFNISKSCLLRFCGSTKNVITADYSVNEVNVVPVTHCKDLGVIFSTDLSWSEHYQSIAAKAYQILGLIKRTFSSSSPTNTKKILFLTLVRSRITYCSQVWRPFQVKDICFLEKIQRRGTKYILNDFNSDYKTRLISLHLLSLMYTYELLDIIFLVRNLKFPDPSFPVKDYIQFSSSSTRVSSYSKLIHLSSRTNKSHHSFFKRVTRLWNALPPIDLTQSVNTIKQQLKEFLWSHFINNFDPDSPCTYHFHCPCNRCTKVYKPPNFVSM